MRPAAGQREGRLVIPTWCRRERVLTLVDVTEWPTVKEAAAAISTDFRHLVHLVSAQSVAN
jgi:hypothetical protein